MHRRARLLLIAAVAAACAMGVVLLAAGVPGGGSSGGDASAGSAGAATPAVGHIHPTAAPGPGLRAFTTAGCGGCHTLRAAGAKGQVGPDLDALRPDAARVARQVRDGGRGMPAFRDRLTPRQIRDVAAYVADAASRSAAPVSPAFKPDDTRLAGCAGARKCLEQAFGNIAYRSGPKVALDRLQALMATDSAVESDCHRIAHTVGAAGLRRAGGDVGRALAEGAATCWSGYYHGVLEHAFAGVPDGRLASVARNLCSGSAVRRLTFIAYQCVHGLGHGLMIHTGYDLPRALSTCDGLATEWDRSSCTGGVFMENIAPSYGTGSRWVRDDQPLYPCTVVAERHKLYCYLMATSRVLQLNGYDWPAAAATCRQSDPGWVATCFQSLGRDASGSTRQDPAAILEHCRVAGDMERECLYGASRDVTSNDAGGARAATLCERAPEAFRPYCFYGIGTILGSLHATADARTAACRALTSRYAADCAGGADGQAPPPPD